MSTVIVGYMTPPDIPKWAVLMLSMLMYITRPSGIMFNAVSASTTSPHSTTRIQNKLPD
jgi:hypothetical protein